MRGPAVRPIVIAAGGTGGHFFPAEALAAEFVARGFRVVLMTDRRSGALNSRVFAGGETHVLRGAGIAGRGALRGLRAVFSLGAGTLQAWRILRRLDAAALIGFGGYPSVAPMLAASFLRPRPIRILHEQNAVLGRANRFLARFADMMALGFAETSRLPPGMKMLCVGNPVRPAIADLFDTPYVPPGENINLLVLGGSLGARVFSDVVPGALAALPAKTRARVHVVQQCRQEDVARVKIAYDAAGIEAELAPFFGEVAQKYAAAHLVISRAGASSCAEIATTGKPSILVPLPGAIDDHQTENARALAQAGAASVISQSAFSPALLTRLLAENLADIDRVSKAAAAAKACARPHAAAALADLVENMMSRGEAVS